VMTAMRWRMIQLVRSALDPRIHHRPSITRAAGCMASTAAGCWRRPVYSSELLPAPHRALITSSSSRPRYRRQTSLILPSSDVLGTRNIGVILGGTRGYTYPPLSKVGYLTSTFKCYKSGYLFLFSYVTARRPAFLAAYVSDSADLITPLVWIH